MDIEGSERSRCMEESCTRVNFGWTSREASVPAAWERVAPGEFQLDIAAGFSLRANIGETSLVQGEKEKGIEMNGNSVGVVLSSGGLGGAPDSSSRPDSEVVAKAKRRMFSTERKIRILDEADSASATPGGVGALLRRGSLCFSHLTSWRR
ncbi:MAG: hypothetical protein ACYDD2_10885 [Candidatus Acidiferrales bacterium]